VERMNFAGLAARAKETKVSEKTGKIARKKRFGKSIGHRAPAMWVSMLKYKASKFYYNLVMKM
jgi:putative IS transposase